MAGTRDTVVPRHNVDEIVRESPAARVVDLEGEHLALDSNPESAARLFTSWMEESGGRAAAGGRNGGESKP